MAIIENRVTAEGDVLIIKPEVPVVGLLALYQFVDTTVGESETDYFLKEFRYSVDGGLTFGDWLELSLINISGVEITQQSTFVIEYRYTRVGNAPEVELEFQDILVSGEVEELPYPVFDKTIFKKFFNVNDISVFGWAINVLEKLYVKGLILPDYIERADNNSNLEDEDFIVYWNSITHFFAIIVYFARQFHNFESNELLLVEFLKSRDITISDNYDISELLYVYQNYVEEYRKRGTNQIIERSESINGELIRLTGSQIFEEFIFAVFQSHDTGWCISKSSPTWRGTENILSLNKLEEELVPDFLIGETPTEAIKITISPKQAYEVSFRLKTSSPTLSFNFGVNCFDKDDNPLTIKNNYNEAFTNLFAEGLILGIVNEWVWIRGIIYPYDSTFDENFTLNTGHGNNLRFIQNVAKIQPYIDFSNVAAGDEIDTFVLRPAKLNFSRGQLGIKNIIYLNCVNNSSKDDSQVIEFVKNKLIPYDSVLKANLL